VDVLDPSTAAPRTTSGSPPGGLFEREAEQAALTDLLAAASHGEGGAMALEAPAGQGKTALLTFATELATAQGMRVLTARGGELERAFPYGVVRQLFERLLAAATSAERERWLAGAAAFATPAVEGADRLDGTPRAEASVLHGLYWVAANLAAERPVLLAIDDIHWSDPPSLAFVSYLADRTVELPLALVCALRPHEGEQALPIGTWLHPAPLTERATAALMRDRLDPRPSAALARACHHASGGNPYLLSELVRVLRTDGLPREDEDTMASLERIASQALGRPMLSRLQRLGGAPAQLAAAVAILGTDAQLRTATRLAGLDPPAATAAADALCGAEVLRPGRPLEFVHPAVQSAVHSTIAPARRAADHRRAAKLLADDGHPAERIAPHLLASEPAADGWVTSSLRRAAATAVRRGAPEVAATYLRRALEEPPPPAERPRLLLELGAAEARAGQAGALEHLRGARAVAADGEARAAVALELSRTQVFDGDMRGAVELLRETLGELGSAHALAPQIEDGLLAAAGLVPELLASVAEPLARAQDAWRAGERALRPVTLGVLAAVAATTGRADDARAMAEHALGVGRLVADQTADAPGVYFATCALSVADGLAPALGHLDTALAEAASRGSVRGFATASCFRAFARYCAGDVRGAQADAAAARTHGDEPGLGVLEPAIAATLIECAIEREGPETAERILATFDRTAPDPRSAFVVLLYEAAARLSLAQHRPRAALEEIRRCERWAADAGVTTPAWTAWRSLAALVYRALDEPERARQLARDEVERARGFGGQRALSIALRRQGLLEGGEPAVELLSEAVATGAAAGARLEQARALAALGSALRRGGHPKDARAPLREALDLAVRCGAPQLAGRAREELVAAGARPRRARLTGVESLTGSELRVARMAADGLTNREIAQALFVTVRTVEGHLTHAYGKLGIRTRRELEQGLATGADSSD
jgi:DNA-binding CsgD family transcriptional regulator/tetratricopeptide (TPR) repeat protein